MDDDSFMNAVWSRVEGQTDSEVDAASVGVRGLRAVMELEGELAFGGLAWFAGNSSGRVLTSLFLHC